MDDKKPPFNFNIPSSIKEMDKELAEEEKKAQEANLKEKIF